LSWFQLSERRVQLSGLFGGEAESRMGYSTAIYAVDLDDLKAAVGSGDPHLLRRLLAEQKGKGNNILGSPWAWADRSA
jgi:hypothetical protein